MNINEHDLKRSLVSRLNRLSKKIKTETYNTGELLFIEDVLLTLKDSFAVINGNDYDHVKRAMVKNMFSKRLEERIESISL